MIFSDREILASIERNWIFIDPRPQPSQISSTAVDLRLGEKLRVWKKLGGSGADTILNPGATDFDVTDLISRHAEEDQCDGKDGYVLEPGQFILGWTKERIYLPHKSRIAARVEGKSSLARVGVGVHVTAPTVHAGFGHSRIGEAHGSPIQLEIWNAEPLRIRLKAGIAVCQLILEEVHGTPERGYSGQFADQGPPVAKKN